MKKVAVMIDGGHLRVLARKDGHNYNPDFIEKFALNCVVEDEQLLRVSESRRSQARDPRDRPDRAGLDGGEAPA